MIKWNSSKQNVLPADKQEVLISVYGVNYISVYDATKRIFRTNELLETFFKAEDCEILWTDDYYQVLPSANKNRSKIYQGTDKKVNSKKA